MTHRKPLPDHLAGRPFDRRAAESAGVRRGRLRRKDLLHPFHGVHVAAPHTRGVVGHRIQRTGVEEVEGLPVVDVVEAFCQLGAVLEVEDLTVVADELLNRTALDAADARALLLERIGARRRIGGARLVKAVHRCRRGSRSPAETRIRLVLDSAGLPAAELNAPIEHSVDGRFLGSPDFVWRVQRVVLEYEGEGHRLVKKQYRSDIVRYDDLAEDGWRVLRATGDDLTREGRKRLAERVRRALDRAR